MREGRQRTRRKLAMMMGDDDEIFEEELSDG